MPTPLTSELIGSGGRPAHSSHELRVSGVALVAHCTKCNIYVDNPAIYDECPVVKAEREVAESWTTPVKTEPEQ